MLVRLMYVSHATRPMDTRSLDALLEVSRRNNEALGLTGMLLYRDGDFLQIIEGEKEAVHQMYERIVADSRHARIILIDESPVEAREFGDWSMGFKRVDDAVVPKGYVDFFSHDLDPQSLAGRAREALDFLRSQREGTV